MQLIYDRPTYILEVTVDYDVKKVELRENTRRSGAHNAMGEQYGKQDAERRS